MEIKPKKTINVTYYGEICAENYFVLQEDLNEAIRRNYDVRLFFSTIGGSMGIAEDIIEMVNTFPNKIEIICSEWLLSAGLMIVSGIKHPIKIGNSCIGLAHAPSIMLDSRNTKKKNSFDSFIQKQEEVFLDEYMNKIKSVLTEEEIKELRAGEDVCIDAPRIRQMIENSNKN